MATLYVAEFGTPRYVGGSVGVAAVPALVHQTVSISGSSVQSSAFNANTRLVRLHADAICSVLFGTNPTALSTSMRLAANQTEYFEVNGSDKVAVITNT